jgi:hypothetical protein
LGKHKVLIDYAKKSIKLTTPDGEELEFVAELVVTTKGDANHAKVNQLDASQGSEVPVVKECHTSVLKSRTEASIHVTRMFNHTHSNNMING